jgi:hypothetical protein
VKHREYFTDVTAGAGTPTAFDVESYAINPGQSDLFPWLSKIAANYESYRFNSLKFIYSTEAPTSYAGTLILAVDYDATDSDPIDKQQALAYRSSVRSAPWNGCEHRSLPEDLHKAKSNFIRPGAQPNGTDLKTYDIGNLFVISQGVSVANAVLGEMYVEYEVELMTPVYESTTSFAAAGGQILNNGTLTLANPFGDGLVHATPNTVGFNMGGDSKLFISERGQYLMVVSIVGTAFTGADPVSAVAGCTSFRLGQLVNGAGNTTTAWYRVTAISRAAGISFDMTAKALTVTNAVLFVAQCPQGSIV